MNNLDKPTLLINPFSSKNSINTKPIPESLKKAISKFIYNILPTKSQNFENHLAKIIHSIGITNQIITNTNFEINLNLHLHNEKTIKCPFDGEVELLTTKIIISEGSKTCVESELDLFTLTHSWLETQKDKVIFKSQIIPEEISNEISKSIKQVKPQETYLIELSPNLKHTLSFKKNIVLITIITIYWVQHIDIEKIDRSLLNNCSSKHQCLVKYNPNHKLINNNS